MSLLDVFPSSALNGRMVRGEAGIRSNTTKEQERISESPELQLHGKIGIALDLVRMMKVKHYYEVPD